MYLPDRPCRNQCEVKSGQRFRKVEHGDLFLTTDPVYLVKMEENKDQVKISGMIAVLSMEEALERANWLLGKKNGLAFWRK